MCKALLIPFDSGDWIYFGDMERCPYLPFTSECTEWMRQDDERLKLLALDRYAEYLMKRVEERSAKTEGSAGICD